MCGIVGVVSKNKHGFIKKQMDVFHELLYVDNFRGDDSTGIFMVNKDGDLELAKEASSSPDFQREKEYHELMSKTFRNGMAIVGHNRKATKGSITDDNAHPFVVDNQIILVHNGTLYGDYKKLIPEDSGVEVDSHAIAHLIHKHGDDVAAAMQEIQGAFTLVWFDMKKQTLNFLRNSQRPLAFMETSDSWIFASEKNMLTWMIDRHQLTVVVPPAELGEGIQSIFTLRTNNTWDVESNKIELVKPGNLGQSSQWYDAGAGWDDGSCGLNAVARQYVDEQEMVELRPMPRNDRIALAQALDEMERRGTVFENASNDHVNKISKRRKQIENASAMRKEEENYAVKASAHISANKFLKAEEDFQDQKRYPATAFDYIYVNGTDGEEGYFLYAWLNDGDNFMVRIFVPPEFAELKLTDLTANARKVTVKLTGRSWRMFEQMSNRNADGDGFGMFFGSEVKRVLSIAEATNNEEVSTGS